MKQKKTDVNKVLKTQVKIRGFSMDQEQKFKE